MTITFSLRTATGDFVCTARHGSGCEVAEHLLDEYAHLIPGLCMECRMDERDACDICSLDLNVSNHNAAAIVERLGYSPDPDGEVWGEATGDELFARAALGNVGRDDTGVASAQHGRMVDCGVRPGYYADRLGALEALATVAQERGLVVSWG